jgi:hypothetical protein
MSSSLIAALIVVSQKVIIYIGIPILIIGLLGNILNVIVFLSLKTFRQNSCAFYLTIMSIFNIGQLTTGLLTRIMISGFEVDWTLSSLFYCKFRIYFLQVTSLVSYSSMCLATVDQYLATCSRPRWQQWCNIKLAYHILILITFILIIEQVPCVIYSNQIQSSITGNIICTYSSVLFSEFNAYFNYLILGTALPYSISFSFGLMAYYNVQQLSHRTVPLVRRKLDKQLTIMVLVQLIYNFFSLSPNLIVYILSSYGNITDTVIQAQLNLASSITLCLYYLYYAVSVYLFH